MRKAFLYGFIAQLVEQSAVNRCVLGSSPSVPAICCYHLSVAKKLSVSCESAGSVLRERLSVRMGFDPFDPETRNVMVSYDKTLGVMCPLKSGI